VAAACLRTSAKTADKTLDSTTNEDVNLAKIKGSTAEVPYWNSYAKDDGLSYVAQCKFSNLSDASFGKDLQPSWLNWLPVGNLKPLLTVMPVGFYNAGHTSPNPVQLTIVLSDKVQWTFSSGQKIVFSPGQLFLEEEHLAEVGHETENVGDTPAVVLVMAATEITDSYVRDQHQPCRFPQAYCWLLDSSAGGCPKPTRSRHARRNRVLLKSLEISFAEAALYISNGCGCASHEHV
jgi:hypothetical protein